jgi:5-methylthioribose kinase
MWYAVAIFGKNNLDNVVDFLGKNRILYDVEEIADGAANVLWVSDKTSENDILIIKAIELDEVGRSGHPMRIVEES